MTGEVSSEFVFEARVSVAPPMVIDPGPKGLRRVIPILGGVIEGPRLRGTVLEGGADWQYVRPDGVVSLEARYTLQADDGTLIMVINRGMRHGPPEVLERIFRGEAVDPSEYYFRTVAEFEAPQGPHDWLNKAIFVGVARRTATEAIVRLHRIT